jgi:hypothetical protein
MDKISSIDSYDHHTLEYYSNMILKDDNDVYFYVYDTYDKIRSIQSMPQYIQNDWFKYNRKELNITIINRHIGFLTKLCDSEVGHVLYTGRLFLLKSIRRNLIINGII